MVEPRPLMTSTELAAFLGVARRTVTRWATAGLISPVATLPSGQHRWDPDAVTAQLRAARVREV